MNIETKHRKSDQPTKNLRKGIGQKGRQAANENSPFVHVRKNWTIVKRMKVMEEIAEKEKEEEEEEEEEDEILYGSES